MQAGLSTGHTERRRNCSVQDVSHPIKQVILTHPVTLGRLGKQRGFLSRLDGTINRGEIENDTATSVIICANCWEGQTGSLTQNYFTLSAAYNNNNNHKNHNLERRRLAIAKKIMKCCYLALGVTALRANMLYKNITLI